MHDRGRTRVQRGSAPAARAGRAGSRERDGATAPPGRCAILTRMESIIVRGGRPLSGEVRVEGAKNSALKLMAAALLAPGVSRITNVPDIADVEVMAEVLAGLGARVVRTRPLARRSTRPSITSFEAPYELVAQMRASIAVLGPLVARLRAGARRDARRLQHRFAQDRHAHQRARGARRRDPHRARLHRRDRARRAVCGRRTSSSTSRAWAPPRTCSWPSVVARGHDRHRERRARARDRRPRRLPQRHGRAHHRRRHVHAHRSRASRRCTPSSTAWSATASRPARSSSPARSPAARSP